MIFSELRSALAAALALALRAASAMARALVKDSSVPSASTVNIGSGVKEIGAHAFWGNKQIKRVVIPATVEKLGDLPFGYAENLRSIMIEEGCEAALPPGLAYKTGVSELFVPESITEEYRTMLP